MKEPCPLPAENKHHTLHNPHKNTTFATAVTVTPVTVTAVALIVSHRNPATYSHAIKGGASPISPSHSPICNSNESTFMES